MIEMFGYGEIEEADRTNRFRKRYVDIAGQLDAVLRARAWHSVRQLDDRVDDAAPSWEWIPVHDGPWLLPTVIEVLDCEPWFRVSYAATDASQPRVIETFGTLFELEDCLDIIEHWPRSPLVDSSERAAFMRRARAAAFLKQHTEAFPIAGRFAEQLNALRERLRTGEIDVQTFEFATLGVMADAYMAYRGRLREDREL